MACNATDILREACDSGLINLSSEELLIVIAQLSCDLKAATSSTKGIQAGSGSPVGVVTPDYVGQLYSDYTGQGLWQATGLTSADWTQLI